MALSVEKVEDGEMGRLQRISILWEEEIEEEKNVSETRRSCQ